MRALRVGMACLLISGCGGSSSKSSESPGQPLANATSKADKADCATAVDHAVALYGASFEKPEHRKDALAECQRRWTDVSRTCALSSQTPGELLECRDEQSYPLFVAYDEGTRAQRDYAEAICRCQDMACFSSTTQEWEPKLLSYYLDGMMPLDMALSARTKPCLERIFDMKEQGATETAAPQPEEEGSVTCEQAVNQYISVAGKTPNAEARKQADDECHVSWGRATKACVARARSRDAISACRTPLGDAPHLALINPLTAFEEFVEKVCACPDMECVEKEQKEWARIGSELARDMRPADAAAFAKKMEPLTKKLTECVERIAKDQANSP